MEEINSQTNNFSRLTFVLLVILGIVLVALGTFVYLSLSKS